MNKFKLWLSRNDFKILLVVVCFVVIYIFIKNINHYYETIRKEEQNTANLVENVAVGETENTEVQVALQEMDSSSEEFTQVSAAIEKLLTAMYQAKNSEDATVKQQLYNLFSEELLEEMFREDGTATATGNSILNYISNIDTLEKYSVGKILAFSENNHVVRYVVEEVYQVSEDRNVTIYMVINIDYNHKTFSYDGNVSDAESVKSDKKIDFIVDNGSNSLE